MPNSILLCHQYGFLEPHAEAVLPMPLASALRDLCDESSDHGDMTPSEEERQPLLGTAPRAPDEEVGSRALALAHAAGMPADEEARYAEEAQARRVNRQERASRLLELYTTISKHIANLGCAVPAAQQLAVYMADTRNELVVTKDDSEEQVQPKERAELDRNEAEARAADEAQPPTYGRLRQLQHCLERNTHVVAHLKHYLNNQMKMCENTINALNDVRLRTNTVLEQRKKQRIGVEEKIWRAGNRANMRSVERAQRQIEEMDRDEARQRSEMEDQEDYIRHLSDSKRWIMRDLDVVAPLEQQYDEQLLPPLKDIVKSTTAAAYGDEAVVTSSDVDLPALVAKADTALVDLSRYLDQLAAHMSQYQAKLEKVRGDYLVRLKETVSRRSSLHTAACQAVLQRAWHWRTRALELTYEEQAAQAAEQQRQFEATLEAELAKHNMAQQRRTTAQQRRKEKGKADSEQPDEEQAPQGPVEATAIAPPANGTAADSPPSSPAEPTPATRTTSGASVDLAAGLAVAVTVASAEDAEMEFGSEQEWQEGPHTRRRKAKQVAEKTTAQRGGSRDPDAGDGRRAKGRAGRPEAARGRSSRERNGPSGGGSSGGTRSTAAQHIGGGPSGRGDASTKKKRTNTGSRAPAVAAVKNAPVQAPAMTIAARSTGAEVAAPQAQAAPPNPVANINISNNGTVDSAEPVATTPASDPVASFDTPPAVSEAPGSEAAGSVSANPPAGILAPVDVMEEEPATEPATELARETMRKPARESTRKPARELATTPSPPGNVKTSGGVFVRRRKGAGAHPVSSLGVAAEMEEDDDEIGFGWGTPSPRPLQPNEAHPVLPLPSQSQHDLEHGQAADATAIENGAPHQTSTATEAQTAPPVESIDAAATPEEQAPYEIGPSFAYADEEPQRAGYLPQDGDMGANDAYAEMQGQHPGMFHDPFYQNGFAFDEMHGGPMFHPHFDPALAHNMQGHPHHMGGPPLPPGSMNGPGDMPFFPGNMPASISPMMPMPGSGPGPAPHWSYDDAMMYHNMNMGGMPPPGPHGYNMMMPYWDTNDMDMYGTHMIPPQDMAYGMSKCKRKN